VSVPFVAAASFGPPRAEWGATHPRMVVDTRGFTRPEDGTLLPKVTHSHKPRYTAEGMRQHQQGSVVLEAFLDADGTVKAARVTRSLPLLDDEALECVRHWQFSPLVVDGRPTPTVVTMDVAFRLR